MTDGRPRILLTRPFEQSEQFLTTCEARLGYSLDAVISPIIEIVPTDMRPDLDDATTILVTSGNAVRILGPALDGRTVLTVGAATATLAQNFGARSRHLGETAQELLANTDEISPPVLVCRGVHSRIDLAGELQKRGIVASEAVLYDQRPRPLSLEARQLLSGDDSVLAPVFSPRSAELLSAEAGSANIKVLAISDATAKAWSGEADIRVAEAPTSRAMAKLVTEAL